MTTTEGSVAEDTRRLIALGQGVYDLAGKKVGAVDMIFRDTGYFTVLARPSAEKRDNPFEEKYLYVPFRLITSIDPRELFLSITDDQLRRAYADPPARSTLLVKAGEAEIATTSEQSGFTGAPVVVDRVRIDQIKTLIAAGDRVFTTEMIELGKIQQYDAVTGWMLVEKGPWMDTRDLMIPVTLVASVNRETREVYLVASRADLRRLQLLDPAHVVFAESTLHQAGESKPL